MVVELIIKIYDLLLINNKLLINFKNLGMSNKNVTKHHWKSKVFTVYYIF